MLDTDTPRKEDDPQDLSRDGDRDKDKERNAKAKGSAKGTHTVSVLWACYTHLASFNSQRSITRSVQIFQGGLLHSGVILPLLAHHLGARAGEGSLRVVCKGEL